MVFDTNILIAYANGERSVVAALSHWRLEGRPLFISSISVAETLALPTLDYTQVQAIKAFLRSFIAIPFDNEVAEIAAMIRRTYRLSIPDAAIAATAFIRRVPLVTRDRQFLKVSGITVLEI